MSSYYSQGLSHSLCSKKEKRINEIIMKKKKTIKEGLIRALRIKEKKTFKNIEECRSIYKNRKKYSKCIIRKQKRKKNKQKNDICNKTIKLVDSKFGKCVHDISLVKMKKVKDKLNNMKGWILSTSVKKKSKKFARIQCHLITVIKILESSNINFNLSGLRDSYIKKITNNLNKLYADIFFNTMMNDNVFEKNLGYIFFVVDELKEDIVMPLIDTIENYVNKLIN